MFRKVFRSIAALFVFITGCKARYTWNTEEEYYRLPKWQDYVNKFEKMNYPPHTTILFIGDSMTEGFDLKKHLGGDSLVNMGIGGDFTSGVLKRLYILDSLRPRKVFVMIGINDILMNVPQERIETQYGQIILHLRKYCEPSTIYVQSCLPTTGMGGSEANNALVIARVKQLNNFLVNECDHQGVNFINLYPLFEEPMDHMNGTLTYDGLHLNEEGNKVWAQAIAEVIK